MKESLWNTILEGIVLGDSSNSIAYASVVNTHRKFRRLLENEENEATILRMLLERKQEIDKVFQSNVEFNPLSVNSSMPPVKERGYEIVIDVKGFVAEALDMPNDLDINLGINGFEPVFANMLQNYLNEKIFEENEVIHKFDGGKSVEKSIKVEGDGCIVVVKNITRTW
ncbi:gp16 [Listeria phage A511]|uniref:Gp16 n=1 Tax=Listeria phage A511 TaxID=2908169 RepID=A8AT40_BPA51|nr:gp16 [Listeria phage A511]AAY52987.1 gp16 [Listeria phage A511]